MDPNILRQMPFMDTIIWPKNEGFFDNGDFLYNRFLSAIEKKLFFVGQMIVSIDGICHKIF